MAKKTKVYVFSGKFESREHACLYSEPQWEPEPDESVSDEEYEAWEDRNPTHQLEQNLDSYLLDEDAIETIDDMECLNRYDYLCGMLTDKSDINSIKDKSTGDSNILVLVFEDALGGFGLKSDPVSTDELIYCGSYQCEI